MATISNSNLNSYYNSLLSDYSGSNSSSNSSSSAKTAALKSLQSYTNSQNSSSSNDFFSSRVDDFSNQASQYMALAKQKIANKSAVTGEIKTLNSLINNKDTEKAQTEFNAFLAHIDQSKLTTKATTALASLREALNDGDMSAAKSALYTIQRESKSFTNAYKQTTSTTSTSTSNGSQTTSTNDAKEALKKQLQSVFLNGTSPSTLLSSLSGYA